MLLQVISCQQDTEDLLLTHETRTVRLHVCLTPYSSGGQERHRTVCRGLGLMQLLWDAASFFCGLVLRRTTVVQGATEPLSINSECHCPATLGQTSGIDPTPSRWHAAPHAIVPSLVVVTGSGGRCMYTGVLGDSMLRLATHYARHASRHGGRCCRRELVLRRR